MTDSEKTRDSAAREAGAGLSPLFEAALAPLLVPRNQLCCPQSGARSPRTRRARGRREMLQR